MNIKKFTSYAVALMMSLSLAPVKANALTTDGSLTKGYYNDAGRWVEGQLSQTLPEGIQSVDKTAEALGNNTYKMKLKVVTKSIRDAAKAFVQSYAGKDKNTGRYLAVVDFDSDVEVRLNWTDVSSVNGKKAAYEAIDDLRALGGTNLDAGIKQGTSLFSKDAVKNIKKENRNAIVFTDGKPKKYLVECEHRKPKKNDIVIDGIVYDKKRGTVKEAALAAAEDAELLRNQSTVYAVSYGTDRRPMWKGGPTVSEYLRGSIATSPDKGYDRSETDDLTELFKAISDSITTGITGKDLEVFDGSAPYVSVNNLPTSVQQDASGFKWKLANPTTKTEGKATYYTYELEYTVTLDADHPEFEEGKLYPLNGETYITMPNGNKVKFPVPGATGIKTRYTVTYTDGVDGEVVFEDKVFNVVVGSSTPGFGGTPTRAGYTFTGWSPAVEEKDTFDPMADVTAEDAEDGNLTAKIVVEKNDVKTDVAGKYEVTYKVTDNQGATRRKTIIVTVNPKMEVLNEAPVIHATDKTITVGDTFDPMADVTATDAEDGNLTTKIEVKKNDVDTTKAGKYEVTYKVTDNQGATCTKTIAVTVNPKMEVLNEAPTIDAADKTITVGDTFDPKAGVTAKDAEDGDLTDKIEVVKNTVDTKKAGKYEVTYKVTDSDGATRTKTIKVTVKEKAPAPSTDKDKTPTTPNKDKDKTTTVAPKTGDTTSVNTIIALLAVSGIALLALLKRKKVS